MIPLHAAPEWAQPLLDWFRGQPVMSGLLLLMGIDVGVGLMLAIAKKTLNSTISWRGMSRKAIMLLIVGACGVLQPSLPTIPLLNVVAFFYTLTEAISILEGAAAAGVPLPQGLTDTLSKLREQQRVMQRQKETTTTNNITVITAPTPRLPDPPDAPPA